MSVPNDLEIDNKTISFPYINSNINTDPTNRLLVDVTEASNFYTVSLKIIFHEYYPQYNEYLQTNADTALHTEIYNYYNTVILTHIEYKYKVGQFGYISNGKTLEESFVVITDKLDLEREIFFLHDQLKKYKFLRYDITSATPKVLPNTNKNESEWILESSFIPINGTIDSQNAELNHLVKLLNWKIAREDYLLRKIACAETGQNTFSDESTLSDTEKKQNISSDVLDTTSSYGTLSCSNYGSSDDDITDNDNKKQSLSDFGYYKATHLCYTLRGELFVALRKKSKQHKDIEVGIKTMVPYVDGIRIVVDARFIKDALITRHLQTESTLIKNSIVKYVDFFYTETKYYCVFEKDFSVNLKEFVDMALAYVKEGKLAFHEYCENIKYLLWRLTITMYWLHNNIKACELDICPENILLSGAEFIKHSNGCVTINLQIDVKFIDVSVNEILQLCNYNKLNDFKFKYNKEYLELKNEQYIVPTIQQQLHNSCAVDMWNFGMVIYYCFFGSYPYNQLPKDSKNESNNDRGYWSIYNNKLADYIEKQSSVQLVDPKIISLIVGLLCVDETKRLKSVDVLKHAWFNSFYKAWLSLQTEQT